MNFLSLKITLHVCNTTIAMSMYLSTALQKYQNYKKIMKSLDFYFKNVI